MKFDVLTLFPEMLTAYLQQGVLGRAVKRGLVDVNLINIRDFAKGTHKTTDDRPYGGGEGMVMKPGPIYRALKSVDRVDGRSPVILLSPQGKLFDQSIAWEMSGWDQLILVCGRYEGVDERIKLTCTDMELSIGDYVLSGGELGAMVIVDAVSRLIPGVLGGERSNLEDSFEDGLLEYPQYTRPGVFQDKEVPDILLSGNHEKIRVWRRKESLKRTLEKRPDLLKQAKLTPEDKAILAELL
ncbi:MAG: tRNA (guanosine(37)-N1)-methyltransferase TrmD [Desulfobacteraceae bacterium]|jgi:tRNA (guanine37-N1)-methyltransferase|nr:tRNA (guanosine(37)-N1)-methyltransferase TrmD [Desulfobacteraceae bacterium]